LETYVVKAPANSGDLVILGAAAKKFNKGDIVIIMNFAYYTPEEIQKHKPTVIVAGENNTIKEIL